MKIPQPSSGFSILSAGMPVSTAGTESAFSNNGLGRLAQGLNDVSRGILLNRKTSEEIIKQRKEKDDALWVEQTLSNYHRGLTDFEVDKNNQGRTDYLEAFDQKATADVDAAIENAPSPEAADLFRRKARDTVDSRYGRIASTQASNELSSDLNTLEMSWGNTLSAYHKLSATDSAGAAGDLLDNLANTSESIMTIYGQAAPDTARKLVASKIEQAAMALADKSPELAKKVVIDNPYMDEQSRQVIINRIDKKKEEVSLVLKDDFATAREKAVVAAAKNGTAADIPIEDYQRVYPGEEGIVMKRRDDSKIQAAVSSHSFLNDVRGMTPAEKQKKAEEFNKLADTEDKMQAYGSIIVPALTRDQRLFDTDSVQWLYENNDTVVNLQKEIDALQEPDPNQGGSADNSVGVFPPKDGAPFTPDPTKIAATREQLYNTILRYQGFPTEGADSKRFMNKPPGQRRLLAKSQAETYANQINSGTIDQVVSTINGILDNYPTDELRAQVISDLTSLPTEKVKPEYQVAFQNATQSWLPDYIGAIQNVGELADMSIIDKAKLKTTLASNKTWLDFKASVSGPQNQRSKELAGYFDAIEIYARTKVAKSGMDPKKAVDEAISQILTSTMMPVTIPTPAENAFGRQYTSGMAEHSFWSGKGSNQQLWIPRTLFGERRSDADLQDIGRRMGIALAHIHPDDVDQSQFAGYDLTDKEKKRGLIARQIRTTGQYYPDPGGQTYHLTVKSAVDGSRVDLRTKDGKLFQLPIDKLPAYTKKVGNEFKPLPFPIEYSGEKDLWYTNTGAFWNFTK